MAENEKAPTLKNSYVEDKLRAAAYHVVNEGGVDPVVAMQYFLHELKGQSDNIRRNLRLQQQSVDAQIAKAELIERGIANLSKFLG